jgi:hypothetical protein
MCDGGSYWSWGGFVRKLVRPAIIFDILRLQVRVELHLQRQRPAPRAIFRTRYCDLTQVRTEPRFKTVDILQVDVANRGGPYVQIVGPGICRGLARDRPRVCNGYIDALGTVVIVIGTTCDLRIINFRFDPIEVLDNFKVEIRIIRGTPEAYFCVESAVGLYRHLREFLPAEQIVGNKLAPKRP